MNPVLSRDVSKMEEGAAHHEQHPSPYVQPMNTGIPTEAVIIP